MTKFAALLALVFAALTSACATEPVIVEPTAPTSALRVYTFMERESASPCGVIASFAGPAVQLCERVEFQSATEVGCAETYVKWLTLDETTDARGARHGVLQVVSETCDSVYDVSAQALRQ